MTDHNLTERIAILETTLSQHLIACEKKHDRNFKIQLMLAGILVPTMLGVMAQLIVMIASQGGV